MTEYVRMVSLVGEQPIANLVPILCLQPQYLDFICTDRTRQIAERLDLLLEEMASQGRLQIQVDIREVHPYDMLDIDKNLRKLLDEQVCDPQELIFNLTGGTKMMAISAYRMAQSCGAPFCYLISEGRQNVIHCYRATQTGELEFIEKIHPSGIIDIDTYLKAHLGAYDEGSSENEFEQLVYEVLKSECDEVKASVRPRSHGNVEIDFVVRKDSRVGTVEVKSGKGAKGKRALEQIITSTEAIFLGTYTKRFLVIDDKYPYDNLKLAEFHNITVIETPSAKEGKFSDEDELKLRTEIKKHLGV